ncbi:SufS family cysteine desulfurase [Candidatus Dependentiae bacterium]|nr:MAG: SufS family cysteine desulfurase [Candidatus Dependentiae bacterium]
MKNIKKDFPIFNRKVNGHPLVYLDNAATAQRPLQVIETEDFFYTNYNSNVHRGVYTIAEEATAAYEQARVKIAHFINASKEEVVFTQGTTASINTVAYAWALHTLKPGDEIVTTEFEHHANLIPWQFVAQKTGATLKYIPVCADGSLDCAAIDTIITHKTKLVTFTLASHILRVEIPHQKIIEKAKSVGSYVLIDAAQAVAHQAIDVQKLQSDFLAFSGHKLFGPTGIGILYIAKHMHEQIEPFFRGGAMVATVDYNGATFQPIPQLLEAGTPPIAQAIGLGAAVDYVQANIDFNELQQYEHALSLHVLNGLMDFKHVSIVGPAGQTSHLVSFTVNGLHAHDVATLLDAQGICVRAGTHCAQPIARKLGISSWLRASVGPYNSFEDIELFLDVIRRSVSD